jgi:hypothetical protein
MIKVQYNTGRLRLVPPDELDDLLRAKTLKRFYRHNDCEWAVIGKDQIGNRRKRYRVARFVTTGGWLNQIHIELDRPGITKVLAIMDLLLIIWIIARLARI